MEILTVSAWLKLTNGHHLKDDVREMARLGDGGELSIQASRYHHCEPRLDNAPSYRSVEIGGEGVLDGPAEACLPLAPYLMEKGKLVWFARVPIEIADRYVVARGGIVIRPATAENGGAPKAGRQPVARPRRR